MDERNPERTAPQEAADTTGGRGDTAAPAPPLTMVTGLVTVGTEDAPACSDGVCR
ncbi:hypothetical protein SUDANB121_00461 [Nocardiopsis dassonvillei]|uniref:hypothetical protein n=1 Tax=Nocardiopsis dassonvillei TaxID=2014 RepID=UPI003F55770A